MKETKTQKLYTETKEVLRQKGTISSAGLYQVQSYLQKTYGKTI